VGCCSVLDGGHLYSGHKAQPTTVGNDGILGGISPNIRSPLSIADASVQPFRDGYAVAFDSCFTGSVDRNHCHIESSQHS
jgi:hypothetical protein